MFKPSRALEDAYSARRATLGLAPGEPYLAMHMRVGNGKNGKADTESFSRRRRSGSDLHRYARCATQMRHALAAASTRYKAASARPRQLGLWQYGLEAKEEEADAEDKAEEGGQRSAVGEWSEWGSGELLNNVMERGGEEAPRIDDSARERAVARSPRGRNGASAAAGRLGQEPNSNESLAIFIASDDDRAKRLIAARGLPRATFSPKSDFHVDRSFELFGSPEGKALNMGAWVELLMLARSQCLVATQRSASRLASCPQRRPPWPQWQCHGHTRLERSWVIPSTAVPWYPPVWPCEHGTSTMRTRRCALVWYPRSE